MYELRITVGDHKFEVPRVADEDTVYSHIQGYLAAFGISVLLSDELRDDAAFMAELRKTGEFTGNVLHAEITVTRTT